VVLNGHVREEGLSVGAGGGGQDGEEEAEGVRADANGLFGSVDQIFGGGEQKAAVW